jgi:peptide/nickel transport system substrate-binding protein
MMRSEPKHPLLDKVERQFFDGKMNRRDFIRFSTLLGVGAGTAYALAGIADPFAINAAQAAANGGTVRIAQRVHPVDSPHTFAWAEPSNITRQVCEYLTRTGQDNITRPYLLEKWEPSADLKTWTLYIRPGVVWRKGSPLTADQVIWNLKRVLDEKIGSSMLGLMKAYMLKEVDKGEKDDSGNPKMSLEIWDANAIEKVDDHTVRLNLAEAQLAVPEHLFHYPMAILDPAEDGKFGIGSNGTGAFELVEFEAGRKAVLKARTEHWHTVPSLDTLQFIDTGDDATAVVAALASKQVDGAYEVDVTQKPALDKIDSLQIYEVATSQTAVIHGKCTRKPFDDAKVRLAMRLAVDAAQVMSLAEGDTGVVGEHHHVCPIHPEYAKLPPFVRDVARAKSLLAEAGYPDGIDSTLTLPAEPTWQSVAAQVMVQQWAEANIRIKLNVIPSAQWWDVWDKVDLGYTVWYHRPLGFMTLSLAYRTGVPWNAPEWSDKEFDTLLTQAEGTVDVEERRKVMEKIETIMQERGPVVQPFWRSVLTFYDKKVQGFKMHPTSFVFGEELSIKA